MKELILTTIATSSVDSLNPIGITQQFLLQGMVKKPRHIWYFILTTGVVNMIFGYLVYYGVMALINNGISYLLSQHAVLVYMLELAVGLLVFFWAGKNLIQTLALQKKRAADGQSDSDEELKKRFKSVAPLALIAIGVVSTVSELTSAVPYFSFLAVLITYDLPFWIITVILIFYNIIYMLPFMIMYFIYIISKKGFDKVYAFFKKSLQKVLEIFLPALFLAIALFIIGDSVVNLIVL